jgi:hypothetical protein
MHGSRFMRVTRTLPILLSLASVSGRLAAQNPPPKLETGANIAVTFSRFAGTASGNPKLQYGFGVGGFLILHLTKNLAIQPELQYVLKGSRFRVDDSTRTSLILGYLQVPVLVKFILPAATAHGVSPHLYAGMAGSLRTDCRFNAKTGDNSVSQTCNDLNEPPPKSWDASAIVGAGANISYIFVDVRFDLGLTRIGRTPGQDDVKNRTLYLMVGTAFRAPQ